jgi:hypothetical protein
VCAIGFKARTPQYFVRPKRRRLEAPVTGARSFEEVNACSALKPLAFVSDTLDEFRLHLGHPPPPHTSSVT